MSSFKNNNPKTMDVFYETDDLEQARNVSKEYSGVFVEYQNPNREVPILLHFKADDGRIFSKYNPDYIEYLKEEFPKMSENEIYNYMNQKIEAMQQEENKTSKKNR